MYCNEVNLLPKLCLKVATIAANATQSKFHY
jgi:hypothetical protein